MSGVVSNTSNHVIATAQVIAVNEATHLSRSAFTTAEGLFRLALLLPGDYTVTVKAAGFAVRTSKSIAVTVSETSSLNITLPVADPDVTIELTGNAETAQQESSALGRAVEQESIEALPLANRNYTQILGLSPGVVVALLDASERGRGTQNVTSNGAKTTSNNIQFHGVDANNLLQNSAANDGEEVGTAIPTPDLTQEFKVQTANYDASYGRGAGANVDLVNKAGSKRFHGSAWEFVRNNIFNANDFFLKLDDQPRPSLKQNQFGASFGGPIFKDKTFFFAAYQRLTSSNRAGTAVTTILPQLTSDRSATTLGTQFCPANHSNAAGYLTNAGGTQAACDGSNINPVALALLTFKFSNGQYAIPNPQVNLPSAKPAQLPVGQSTFAIPASYKENQFSAILDQVMTQRNTLSGRFFYSRAPTSEAFSPNAANVPDWGTQEVDQDTMFVLADTHVFNSNLINVARFAQMRFDGLPAVTNPILATDLGISTSTGIAAPTAAAPGVSINGLFTTAMPEHLRSGRTPTASSGKTPSPIRSIAITCALAWN